jgi:Flp pilus assembly pilin Flp
MVQLGDQRVSGVGYIPKKEDNCRSIRYQRGTSMVEYALIVACIAMLVIIPLRGLGKRTNRTFRELSQTLAVYGAGANGQ